jgi:hypothetical protein
MDCGSSASLTFDPAASRLKDTYSIVRMIALLPELDEIRSVIRNGVFYNKTLSACQLFFEKFQNPVLIRLVFRHETKLPPE